MITCRFEDGAQAILRHAIVHALVEKDGAILLVKRAPYLLEGGKWAIPGGYLDENETVAEGVLRELLEETGWQGEIVALFRIGSTVDRNKDVRKNVQIEFLIHPVAQTGQPDAESTDVRWFPFDQLPPAEDIAFDHGKTIELVRRYRQATFPLPVVE